MSGRVLAAYGLWMTALTAAFYAFPGHHLLLWGAIGLSGAGAVILGVVRHRPRRRMIWVLQAGALLAFASGDATYTVLTEMLGENTPFPSAADAFYIGAFFPLLFAALISLTRSGTAVRDRTSLLDALILTGGVGLLSWIFLVSPTVENPDLTVVQKLVAVAYPLYDVLILALLARLVLSARRTPAVVLLMAGGAGLLVADVLYGFSQLGGAWQVGGPIDLGWVVFYSLSGAAALHPSMRQLTEPQVLRPAEINGRRIILNMSSLIAPAVLLVEALRGEVRDGVIIAVLSAALFLLVVARLSAVTEGHRLVSARERALRRAGAVLLSAADLDEVTGAVNAAVEQLLPAGRAHHVVLTVTGSEAADSGVAMRMCYSNTLDPDVAARVGEFPLVLRCALSAGGREIGDLFIAADEAALVNLQEAAQVLAGQAASVLDRIRLSAEISRRDNEAYFRTLVLNAADVILILDEENRIGYASPSAAAVFGREEFTGVALPDLLDPADRLGAQVVLGAVRAGAGQDDLMDWRVLPPSGEAVHVEVSCRDLRHERTVGGVVVTLRDVTDRRRMEQELIRRAYYDALTGLPNRTLFSDRVHDAAGSARGVGATVGVLILDLDDFNVVNDTLGHDAGDRLLAAVGERLVSLAQPYGAVARLGGDEFGILLENAQSPAAVEQLAEAVLTGFAEPFALPDGVVTAHLSLGVATTADAPTGQDLLSQADIALALAKSTGKARWRRYETSLHTQVRERMQLRAALDQAIAQDEFVLHYQPIVDLVTGQTQGFEALVRWAHPTRGMIPPLQFIQLAEESGLIVPLGRWVLRTAVHTAARWRDRSPASSQYVSVNVSARQFRAPGFVQQVHEVLAESGLPPDRLVLEITESLLLHDDEQLRADLAELRRAGVRIAIDDFGTGYSSLSYLHQVPIDLVKLDKSFVDGIADSAQQLELVNGIVGLAQILRLAVVAEGIETVVDRELLIGTGCQLGQGFLFARPLSEDDALAWQLGEARRISGTRPPSTV